MHNNIHSYCNKNNINNEKNCISVTKRLVVAVVAVVVVAVVVVVVVIVVFVILIITVGDVVELWVSTEGGRRIRRRRRRNT